MVAESIEIPRSVFVYEKSHFGVDDMKWAICELHGQSNASRRGSRKVQSLATTSTDDLDILTGALSMRITTACAQSLRTGHFHPNTYTDFVARGM